MGDQDMDLEARLASLRARTENLDIPSRLNARVLAAVGSQGGLARTIAQLAWPSALIATGIAIAILIVVARESYALDEARLPMALEAGWR